MTTPEYLEAQMDRVKRQEMLEYIRGLVAQATTYSKIGDGPFDPTAICTDSEVLGKLVFDAERRLSGIYVDKNDCQIQVVLDGIHFPPDERFSDDDEDSGVSDESGM